MEVLVFAGPGQSAAPTDRAGAGDAGRVHCQQIEQMMQLHVSSQSWALQGLIDLQP